MRFIGFDFRQLEAPFQISFRPDGWQDAISATVSRSTAHARSPLMVGEKVDVRALTPIALNWNPGNSLPSLPTEQVVSSLVTASDGVPKTASATQLPDILSQRADVLSYRGMGEVMCAGFMIASFDYKFGDPPPPQQHPAARKYSSQDVVVATAYNLAKRTGEQNTKLTMVHSKSTKKGENMDQVHTEQLLCAQLDAFLTTLKANAGAAEVINVNDRWVFKKDGFDLKKLSVSVKIVFEHVDGNVKTDCAACSRTIAKLTSTWGSACKSFDVTVTKGS